MRRSAKSRPVANVMLAYLLLWVLYDLWETQASSDTRFTCFVIGLGIFFLAILPDAFQWSLLAGHRRFWSLLGVLRNEGAVVTAAVPKEAVLREESRAVVDRTFGGSLPSFLAHFMGGKTISDAEADELKAVIDRFREGG